MVSTHFNTKEVIQGDIFMDLERIDFLDSGFTNLNSKIRQLIPIVQNYQLKDLTIAIYAISSWRDNRSAQESCLALNGVLINCDSFGTEAIETYKSFIKFFQIIEPILKITQLDDMVVNDFGEVKIFFDKQFYPVITGSGHTGSVYGAIQYLESLTLELGRHANTQNVLDYLKNMIDSLGPSNLSKYDCCPIIFDLPTEDYFHTVKNYISSNTATRLNMDIIKTLTGSNAPIVKTHFIEKNQEIHPLFNPSLILDYYANLLDSSSPEIIRAHVHSALQHRIESIHLSSSDRVTSTFIYNAKVSIDQKLSSLQDGTFLYAQGKTVLLLVDVDGMENSDVKKYVDKLKAIHRENRLGFVDLNCPVGKRQYFGIKVHSKQPFEIVLFNHYTNLNHQYIHLGDETDTASFFTAVDLIYILMMSENIEEILNFLKYRVQEKAQILSWGGAADIFALWKQEKGCISKGAIEYGLINTSFETSGAYTFDCYCEWQKCFPFHLSNTPMGFPEQWKIVSDENDVNQFSRKGMNPQGGAGFVLQNGGFIFCSYDFLSIMLDQETQHVRSWHDLISGINERFVLEHQIHLSENSLLDNTYIDIHCKSLNTAHENNKYVECAYIKTGTDRCALQYTVDSFKLMQDIASSKSREIESQYLLELLEPLFIEYPTALDNVKDILIKDSTKKKTADVMLKKLDYFINQDYLPLRLSDEALLMTRKTFARIAADNGVKPGKYIRREATNIVRQMQEPLVEYFESQISNFDRLALHSKLLHYYASELAASYINYGGYHLTNNIDDRLQLKNKAKLIHAREENKQMQVTLLYLIESNLFLTSGRGNRAPSATGIENLVAFSHWLGILQSHSDMCFHTSAGTYFIVLDDYRVNVELSEEYQSQLDAIQKRSYESGIYSVQGDEIDKEYFEKLNEGFVIDTGVDFRVIESVLRQLMECSFPEERVNYIEIEPNVIRINKEDAINDYLSFVTESVPVEIVRRAYDFLTLLPEKLKTIGGQEHNILPVWERRQRDERFEVKPLLSIGDSYIYSPIIVKELHNRWTHGWFQFYPPYEIGLDNALKALWTWKEKYENQFSVDIRDAFRTLKYNFVEADVEIHRLDRKGKHPIDLGDYDVIALNMTNKTLFIIECKVLQPVGSVFEHSMQQKGFFQQNKYDEKFQRRINYLKDNYRRFFGNIGYDLGDDEYTVKPFMVVNKVFDSYYKQICFPIVTFDELKKLI